MESFDFSGNEQSTSPQGEIGTEQQPSGIGTAIDLSFYFLLRSTTEVIDRAEAIDKLLSRIVDERARLQQEVARLRSEREALLYHIRELKTATEMETTALREKARTEAATIVADAEHIRDQAIEDAKALEIRIQAAEKRARVILNDLLNIKSTSPNGGDIDSTHLFQNTASQTKLTSQEQVERPIIEPVEYEPTPKTPTEFAAEHESGISVEEESAIPGDIDTPIREQTSTENETEEISGTEEIESGNPNFEAGLEENEMTTRTSDDEEIAEEEEECTFTQVEPETGNQESFEPTISEEPELSVVTTVFETVEPEFTTDSAESTLYHLVVHPIRSFGSLQELERDLDAIQGIDTLEIVDWQSPVAVIEARSLLTKAKLIEDLAQQIPNGRIVKNENDDLEIELGLGAGA